MHEFAIATDIVSTIKTNYSEHYEFLTAINIGIGQFSGIVADSLDFGIEAILKEDGLENVKVKISNKEAKAICECEFEYEVNNMFDKCPKCSSAVRKLLSGDEVTIETIEFDIDEKEEKN